MSGNNSSEKKKIFSFGIAAFVFSVITVLTATLTMSYINYHPETPTGILLFNISRATSLVSPLISLVLAFMGRSEKGRSQTLGYVAIGISLFTLTTVGCAYVLTALF